MSSQPRPGVFLVFEGGDGSGKSTQARRLADHLAAEGHDVVLTREPGGTVLGQTLRTAVLHGEDLDPRTEALIYAADRAHHVATLVRPALDRGAVVVCDRYIDSSVAYQGAARGLGEDEIVQLSSWATGGLVPDLTLVLDLDTREAAGRRGDDPDRLEREAEPFHARVRETYLRRAATAPRRYAVIDSSRSRDDVHADVVARVGELLATGGGR
ncbi:dTMP kinase [Georgenia sp. MJ170]|uniref:dTMP kinase n=1 Tax=Georgenia sunbinii TaxID=3117728 RepID=UPI002F26C735